MKWKMQTLCHAGVQEKLGVMNKGTVYTLWDYKAQNPDELSFSEGDAITILRRQDDSETEWWWAQLEDKEGFVPRNLLGVKLHLDLLEKALIYIIDVLHCRASPASATRGRQRLFKFVFDGDCLKW